MSMSVLGPTLPALPPPKRYPVMATRLPSLGIAPLLVKTIFEKIVEINKELGLTILLVEQNANLALEVSHYGYVLETGRIILQDKSDALRANEQVRAAYLGG